MEQSTWEAQLEDPPALLTAVSDLFSHYIIMIFLAMGLYIIHLIFSSIVL